VYKSRRWPVLFLFPLVNIIWLLCVWHKELKVRKLYFLIMDLGTGSNEYDDAHEAIIRLYDVDALDEAYRDYWSRKHDKSQEKVLSEYL
jgi:hypothetical protein